MRLRNFLIAGAASLASGWLGEAGAQAPGQETGPAYLVVLGEVKDREAFLEGYAARLPPLYEKYGGEYIAIGAGVEILEGDYAPESFVIARWPSREAARAFWNSPEYQELRRARRENEWGRFDVLLVPGLPGSTRAAPALDRPD